MADLLRLSGTIAASASTGSPSGHAALNAAIDEQLSVDHARANLHYLLTADAAQDVAMDGLSACFIMVRASAKVKVEVTSADGTAQAIPGTFIVVRSEDVPFTAISITRQPSIETNVDVMLGISPA